MTLVVRNWKYNMAGDTIGEVSITRGQFMTGNIFGVIVEKKPLTAGVSNMADAGSYKIPVRIRAVDVVTDYNVDIVSRQIRECIRIFEQEGCRAVISSGWRLGWFDG